VILKEIKEILTSGMIQIGAKLAKFKFAENLSASANFPWLT